MFALASESDLELRRKDSAISTLPLKERALIHSLGLRVIACRNAGMDRRSIYQMIARAYGADIADLWDESEQDAVKSMVDAGTIAASQSGDTVADSDDQYDPTELAKGIKEEMHDHGMSRDEAHKTAIDHLKENPHYYSIIDRALKESTGPQTGGMVNVFSGNAFGLSTSDNDHALQETWIVCPSCGKSNGRTDQGACGFCGKPWPLRSLTLERDVSNQLRGPDDRWTVEGYDQSANLAATHTEQYHTKRDVATKPDATASDKSAAAAQARRAYLSHREAVRRGRDAGIDSRVITQHERNAREANEGMATKRRLAGMPTLQQERAAREAAGKVRHREAGSRRESAEVVKKPVVKIPEAKIPAEKLKAKARFDGLAKQQLQGLAQACKPRTVPQDDDLRSLAGASKHLDDGRVSAYGDLPRKLTIQYENDRDGVKLWEAAIYPQEKRMHIDLADIDDNAKPGVGLKAFAAQVEAAQKMGIETIDLEAARRDGRFVGYCVWPVYGFDGPLPERAGGGPFTNRIDLQAACQRDLGFVPTKVSDFYKPGPKQEERRAWWVKNGNWMDMAMDIIPGSKQMKFFQEYLDKKRKQGIEV